MSKNYARCILVLRGGGFSFVRETEKSVYYENVTSKGQDVSAVNIGL